jgi:hypothetical protein
MIEQSLRETPSLSRLGDRTVRNEKCVKQGQANGALSDFYWTAAPYDDWQRLVGSRVEVRRRGCHVRLGVVESATRDGAAIWLAQEGALTRMLVHKDEGYQVWVRPLQFQ